MDSGVKQAKRPPPLPPKGNQLLSERPGPTPPPRGPSTAHRAASPRSNGVNGPAVPPRPKKPEKRMPPPKPKLAQKADVEDSEGTPVNGAPIPIFPTGPPPTVGGRPPTGAMTPAGPSPTGPLVADQAPPMPQRELTPEEKAEAKKAKRKRTREKVAKEIVSTELSYVESLEVLNKLYIIPLLSSSSGSSPILAKEVIDQVFSNIQLIAGLNRKFLTDLSERVENWDIHSKLGNVFIEFAHFFKMYTSYVNNHDTALDVFKKQVETNDKFAQFCEEKEQLKESQTQVLSSFLIMPIQRVPRYKLLLEEMIKNTEEDHPDYSDLSQALSLVKDVAAQINEAVKSHENRAIIIQVQEQFQGDVTFVEPSRVFIRKGALTKKCRSSDKRYVFFLFSDLLVYAAKLGFKYKLHRDLPINGAFVVQDLADDGQVKNKFQIVSKNKSFVVFCDDQATKDSWLEDLYQCINLQKTTNLKTDPSEGVGVLAPVWQPDKSAKSCSICSAKFSMFHRRHHCRRCGNLVCGDCSKTRAILKANDAKRIQRVCDRCILELKKKSTPSTPEPTMDDIEYDDDLSNSNSEFTDSDFEEEKNTREVIRHCKALYEYTADDDRELTMSPGDIIAILHEDDSGWWTGELNEQQGIFPSTYVEVLPDEDLDGEEFRMDNPLAARMSVTADIIVSSDSEESLDEDDGAHYVISAMDYTPVADGELGFSEGDRILVQNKDPSGWWCGKRLETGEVGWFSPEFVQELDSGPHLENQEPVKVTLQPLPSVETPSEAKPCSTCDCRAFAPNPFRPKSCRDCWHNLSFHV